MCRLFGLHAGASAVAATFWLLDAPDSLAAQSHRNPDGAGIGVFDGNGRPTVDKQPMAAWDDVEFAAAARELTGTTFVAHVRHASTGALTAANTHPFEQGGRLFAHNGVIENLDRLDERLDELGVADLVEGDTDSERMFALITGETARQQGDVRAGLTAALEWIAENLPLYSANFLLITATDLWALRYPDTNELWVLERAGNAIGEPMDARTDRIHARSHELATRPSVILASEPMDHEQGWRLLASGELLHVAADLSVNSQTLLPQAPAHPLSLTDLAPDVAASQQATRDTRHDELERRMPIRDPWGLNERAFAWYYPRLVGLSERAGGAALRARALGGAVGRTLEIGTGNGYNLPHYAPAVTELVMTEPSPHMVELLRARLAADPPLVGGWEVIQTGAEALPFPDASFDTVTSGYVLCSVPFPERAIAEVARVLKPGGRYLFLEHVRARNGSLRGRVQDVIEPLHVYLAAGCHPNRDTEKLLRNSELLVEEVEHTAMPMSSPSVRPVILGSARRPEVGQSR